jgi:hypothetical protein
MFWNWEGKESLAFSQQINHNFSFASALLFESSETIVVSYKPLYSKLLVFRRFQLKDEKISHLSNLIDDPVNISFQLSFSCWARSFPSYSRCFSVSNQFSRSTKFRLKFKAISKMIKVIVNLKLFSILLMFLNPSRNAQRCRKLSKWRKSNI